MSVKRIVPNIAAEDPTRDRTFYTEVLGLDVGMDMGWIVTFVSKDGPTAQLSLVKTSEALHADYSIEVTDLDACHARAMANSCDVVYPLTQEPWGVRRFFLRDPHGKIVNVMAHA